MERALSRKASVFLTCVVFAAFAGADSARAQAVTQLSGTVLDATGASLPDVTITLDGAVYLSVRSGPDGRFRFPDLAEGQYELTAVRAGFATARRSVRLEAGQPVALSLTLTVAASEETIVTATKTGEKDPQAVPIAVSVLPAAELARLDAHTVGHMAGLAPTVTFSQNTGFAQLTIRGIGTNVVFAGSDPSSAVYVDGVYFARPAAVFDDFLGLERVEVLRGPQGTLYGRNTIGGAVNVITRRPTNDVEAAARLIAGNAKTLRSEARASGPLVPDKVLGSVAFLRGVRNGFVRDLDHPDRPLGGEDVTAAQGKLNVVFNPRTDLLLSADVTHQDPVPLSYAKVLAVKPGFQVDTPVDPHEVRTSVAAESRRLHYGGSVRLTMQLGQGTELTSLTAFRKLDYELVVDADITELDLTISNVHEIHHQWSQELTLSREQPGLSWLAGVFLFDEVDRQPSRVTLGGPRLLNYLDPRVGARSGAVFGQGTIDLTRRLSATGGLRVTHERKTIDNAGELSQLDPPQAVVPGSSYAYTDSLANTAWSPRLGLQLRTSANTQAYVSATRGFKSGGFNLTSAQAGRGYAPEWVWSYEGGVKTTGANGRMKLNVAAFLADYTDLQVQTAISPGVIDISNAAEARIRGIEMEGSARLSPALNAGGHLAWLDTAYEQYVAVGVGGVTGDVAGRRLTNAPVWSGRQWLEWNHEVGRTGRLSLRADARWQSTVYYTPFNDAIQRQRPYGLLDLSAEYGPAGRHWSIVAYVRNLTDEDYITGAFSSPPPAIGGRPGDSRQFGIQMGVGR